MSATSEDLERTPRASIISSCFARISALMAILVPLRLEPSMKEPVLRTFLVILLNKLHKVVAQQIRFATIQAL